MSTTGEWMVADVDKRARSDDFESLERHIDVDAWFDCVGPLPCDGQEPLNPEAFATPRQLRRMHFEVATDETDGKGETHRQKKGGRRSVSELFGRLWS